MAKLADELAVLSTDLEDLQKNEVSGEQFQDLATGDQVQAVDDKIEVVKLFLNLRNLGIL